MQSSPVLHGRVRRSRRFLNENLGRSCCDIVVNADAAHQFALIIHELATNALKYGALSVPRGRISILGKVKQASGVSQFSLTWSEKGGPPVAKPTRKGFGSVILFDAANTTQPVCATSCAFLRIKFHPPCVRKLPRFITLDSHFSVMRLPSLSAGGHGPKSGLCYFDLQRRCVGDLTSLGARRTPRLTSQSATI